MRGHKTNRSASIVIGGKSLIENVRRGHDELGVDTVPGLRLATSFDGLGVASWSLDPFERPEDSSEESARGSERRSQRSDEHPDH